MIIRRMFMKWLVLALAFALLYPILGMVGSYSNMPLALTCAVVMDEVIYGPLWIMVLGCVGKTQRFEELIPLVVLYGLVYFGFVFSPFLVSDRRARARAIFCSVAMVIVVFITSLSWAVSAAKGNSILNMLVLGFIGVVIWLAVSIGIIRSGVVAADKEINAEGHVPSNGQ